AGDNQKRAALARQYQEGLAGSAVALPCLRAAATHVFHLYVVRTPRRNELQQYLAGQGIGTLVHYPVPVHHQPAYQGRLAGNAGLPETERAAREVLSLPMYPELQSSDVQSVIAAIRSF